jgi:ubiquinol-cytochrome c reductase iron-sulfur subunit
MSVVGQLRRWLRRHEPVARGPQVHAAVGFGLTALGAIGFGWCYVVDASNEVLGSCLAVALAGLAYGFASWAALLPPGPVVEEREPMVPRAAEVRALEQDLDEADHAITAAVLPRRMLTLGMGLLGLASLLPLRSLLTRGPGPGTSLSRTAWAAGTKVVREDGTPVRPDDLEPGTALTVFPENHVEDGDVAVLLMRVDADRLRLPPDRMAWTVDGVVGYSKICTHAGCPVGLFVQGRGELMCPCHQSVFDVLRGAEPTSGPADRPLPQLPMALDADGTLVALGDFTEPVGPGYWRRA